jgi:hypothetical protein
MGNHGQSAESDPSPLIERYKKLVDPDSEVHAKKCSQRKQRKEKNECYRDQKGKRGNVRNHCRALSRGHVATKHGVVTLTGFVSSFWEKDAAEKDAILVHAVKGVANDIEVRPFWQPTDPDIAPVFTVDADFVLVTAAIPGVVTELEHRGLRIAWHPFTVNAQKPGSDLVIQFSTDECFQDFPAGAVPAEVLLPELLRDKLV